MEVDIVEMCATHRRLRLAGPTSDGVYVVSLSRDVGCLRLRVLASDGSPVKSAISLMEVDRQCTYVETPDEQGWARFVGARAGEYRVLRVQAGVFVEIPDVAVAVDAGRESERIVRIR
jgi:hypothetical protein